MNIDPSADLQQAVFSALVNSTDVANAIGRTHNLLSSAKVSQKTVFDLVPENPTFPFLQIGDDHILLGEAHDYSSASEAHVLVNIYSRTPTRLEAKRIVGAVRTALDLYLPVNNFRTVNYKFVGIHNVGEADGLTTHLVAEFFYELQAN